MNKIDVSNISFDELKSSFIEFAKSKSQYSDWEFGGSNISFLIDMLTYSTYYNNVYQAMMLNETFLDTATQRSSVVARAKEHGYIPRSKTSAYMNVTVSIDTASLIADGLPLPTSITIPTGSKLNVKIQDIIYTFNTLQTYVIYNVNGVMSLEDVMFYEGHLTTFTYNQYLNSDIIVPVTADISTLKLYVDGVEWEYTKNAIGYNKDSTVFYYYENGLGEYSVYFGDNIISKKPDPTSRIDISYLESAGPNANAGISPFEVSNTNSYIANGIDYTKYINFSTSIPTGGANRESIEEIRDGALRRTITQNRAVTVKDFIYIIESEFYNDVLRCNAWDINSITDSVNPLDLGKVYITIQPRNYRTTPYIGYITQDKIYRTLTSSYTIGGIRIEIVDPIYIKINHNIDVYYDKQLLDNDINTVKLKITSAIKELYDSDIIKFDTYLPISRIQAVADSVDKAIISTNISITCGLDIQLETSVNLNKEIKFNNTIAIGSITSNMFNITDSHTGKDTNNNDIGNLVSADHGIVGTINYTLGTGSVVIPGNIITSDAVLSFNFSVVTPQLRVNKEFIMIDSDKYTWNFINVNEGLL
jgi:hypothetical protein